MILGAGTLAYGRCFEEIDDAVSALTDRFVVFNAHQFEPPPGAIIFNLENIEQVKSVRKWANHEIWDCSPHNAVRYPPGFNVKHVPMGFHPSMVRFQRRPPAERDVDVVFCGSEHPRRAKVLEELRRRGLKVVHNVSVMGRARDALLARSKIAIDMLFYEGGMFPALRQLHLIANRVPVIGEYARERPSWCGPGATYDGLVDAAIELVKVPARELDLMADAHFAELAANPLVLPS
jgi:hypothetical protein